MVPFATEQEKQERRETIAHLRTTSPEFFLNEAKRATLHAFQRQVREVPAYRALIGPDACTVTDIESFKARAPILDKHNTFAEHAVRDLCRGGSLEGVRSILTSSGHSGVFSFGVNTTENLARSSRSIDVGLQYIFGVDERATLLINALPMGVKINTKATVLAETSTRDDMVFALVKKFASDFDQIIIVAEGSFAKKIVEDGAEYHGIDWRALSVSLITGEEGIAENYRTYIGNLLGIDDPARPGGKLVMSSMGIAELDLNIFHETNLSNAVRLLPDALLCGGNGVGPRRCARTCSVDAQRRDEDSALTLSQRRPRSHLYI
jgi:phenylacetate-CoA ligase